MLPCEAIGEAVANTPNNPRTIISICIVKEGCGVIIACERRLKGSTQHKCVDTC